MKTLFLWNTAPTGMALQEKFIRHSSVNQGHKLGFTGVQGGADTQNSLMHFRIYLTDIQAPY